MTTSVSHSLLSRTITTGFLSSLSQPSEKILVEYVWIGGSGEDLRCKTRTIDGKVESIDDIPVWNYDGSSTGQAMGVDSEVILRPRTIFRDPFRGGDNLLVMCDCYKGTNNTEWISTNTRAVAAEVMERAKDAEPWFGMEQEYTMFETDGHPLGWPKGGFPAPQGPYYCGAGADRSFGREFVESHYRACLHAGVKIAGINAEVMPGQWEFQIGPCEGILIGDHLWIARYIMHRLGELFRVVISFDPKPIRGDWNGAGCHTNFSTKAMREEGGYSEILKAVDKLSKKHHEHMVVYGKRNERQLTSLQETAPIDQFSWGVANRGASIRIPRSTEVTGRGYFEDRRPASNCDPYLVAARLVKTVVLNE